MRILFLTVTDSNFFPGTLATVNSILQFHPESNVAVVVSGQFNSPITGPQADLLKDPRVRLYQHSDFDHPGSVLGAWQLKAYAAASLLPSCDVLIGIDSDALLASTLHDLLDASYQDGKFRGGKDGDGPLYDSSYASYGLPVPLPVRNPRYMSTSLYICGSSPRNLALLREWSACCDRACFGPQEDKVYPGHGDQGVLNAVLFKHATDGSLVELLENRTVSQHWAYEQDTVILRDPTSACLVNVSAGRMPMRGLHCGGSCKWWSISNSERLKTGGQGQRWPYAWFLYHLWFGPLTSLRWDPYQWLPPPSRHLIADLIEYFPMLVAIDDSYAVPGRGTLRERWRDVGDSVLARCTDGVPRALSLGSSMSTYIRLAKQVASPGGTIVEIGGFHGGSALTLAIALLAYGTNVCSVESFTGNLDGTVDGHPLPCPQKFVEALRKYPTLALTPLNVDSLHAARRFTDRSLDMVFIDGNHSESSVARDIQAWLPKVRSGGVISGDDYDWAGVRAAVSQHFGYQVQREGPVWWCQVDS